jgi:hypothetical protein
MRHLNEAEFVDLMEGQLRGERFRHVETCAACRSQAETLGAVLRSARVEDVPEPSPLFWDHLSARISRAVDAESAPSWWTRLTGAHGWRLAAAGVALILLVGLTFQMLFRIEAPVTPPPEQPFVAAGTDPDMDGFVEAWDAIEGAAVDLDWEEVQALGLTARPGSADAVVLELTEAERSELARLLETK